MSQQQNQCPCVMNAESFCDDFEQLKIKVINKKQFRPSVIIQ